ncbi:MAG: nitrogen regulation protein NR(II) [Thermoanaerobaculia bacterium]
MSETTDRAGSRRLAIGLAALLVFILLDIGLFGWLIFRSLSEREIRRVLLETRAEAESVAEQIAEGAVRQGGDLYTVVAVEREVRTYVDSVLAQKDLIHKFEIRDREGVLVYSGTREDSIPMGNRDPELILEGGELGPRIERTVEERPRTFDATLPSELDVPIGDLGFLRVALSRGELERRVSELRTDLVRNTTVIGVMTLLVLCLAYWIVWRLWRRGRRLEEQTVEAERMAYVGTLASGLAHEIRNPLNSLNLNMQLLEEELDAAADPSRSRLLNMTRDEIGRLERLVTDFLTYARPPGVEPDEVSTRELLERCRDLLQVEAAKRGARIAIEDATGGARVRVDPAQLGQLFINLVQNGMAAAHEAGRPPRVNLRALSRGGSAVFEVSDNGTGVPAAEREKIFDLFYSSRRGGTGLGLAIVKRIAQAHEATLEVDSTPGEGTTISLVLPAERSVEAAPVPVAPLEASVSR